MFHQCFPTTRHVVNEISADPDMKLRFVIADCIERHYIKGLVSISGASGR